MFLLNIVDKVSSFSDDKAIYQTPVERKVDQKIFVLLYSYFHGNIYFKHFKQNSSRFLTQFDQYVCSEKQDLREKSTPNINNKYHGK